MASTVPLLDTEPVARAFHALSDGTRLQILQLLRQGERCVCELTGSLAAAQSRLSFHLRILKEAGLVTDRREGRWVYYALNPATIGSLIAALDGVCPAPPHTTTIAPAAKSRSQPSDRLRN